MKSLKYKDYNSENGISSYQYYNQKDYKDLLESINTTVPLNGTLKCHLIYSTYFQMDESQVDLRNQTLYSAISCFEANDMPIHFIGCNEKYDF